MLEEHRLELRGRHLKAFHLDQLLEPIDDGEVAVVIHHANVASVEPPSESTVFAVASGLLRYPFITCGPRTHTSPGCPVGTSLPVSGLTIRPSVLGINLPTVPTRSSPATV